MTRPQASTRPISSKTCSKCHKGATVSFTKFYAHGEPTDRHNYPILFYTFVGMTTLLVGVFAVFWVHTLFWMFRGFIENRHKKHRHL